MSVELRTEVAGVKDAIRVLSQFDRKARNQLTRDFKQITAPVVDEAKHNVPVAPPLSGMGRKWISKKSGVQLLPWDGVVAVKYIKAKVSSRRPREYNGVVQGLAAFTIVWAGGINTLYDMAGRRKTSALADSLNKKIGPASRVMWPAVDTKYPEVEGEMKQLVDDLMRRTSSELARL